MSFHLGLSFILVVLGLVTVAVGGWMNNVRVVAAGTVLAFVGVLVDNGDCGSNC